MKILCKNSQDSKPFEIDYESFKGSISKGEITPGFLINDKVFTGGEWKDVDNCGIFHALSPVKYSRGDILKKEDEAKEKIREAKKGISELQKSYLFGDLIKNEYDLQPLNTYNNDNVFGVSRLWVLHSFDTEAFITFVFCSEEICLELLKGEVSLWYSLPALAQKDSTLLSPIEQGKIFDKNKILKISCSIKKPNAWEKVQELSKLALECKNLCMDGVGYYHEILDGNSYQCNSWSNPERSKNKHHYELLDLYSKIINGTQIKKYLKYGLS